MTSHALRASQQDSTYGALYNLYVFGCGQGWCGGLIIAARGGVGGDTRASGYIRYYFPMQYVLVYDMD